MFCKWCGMDSATTDRCSWCNGILAPEAKAEKPDGNAAEDLPVDSAVAAEGAAAVENAGIADKTAKRVPAPPVGGMRRTPAPPVPPHSLRKETPTSAEAPNFAAPLEMSAPEPSLGEPTAAFMSPTIADAPPPADAQRTILGTVEPTAESEEEFGGLAAGQAKPVEKTTVPSAETQMFSPNAGPAMSKYYPGKTIEETTGIGANDYIPPPPPPETAATKPNPNRKKTQPDLHIEWVEPEVSSAAVWGKFAAALAGVLAISGALALALKGNILLPLLLANFAMGVLIPVLRVGPWQDEESDDSIFLLVLTTIFGPFVALVIYSVMSAVKQMTNPAVLGILISAAAIRLALVTMTGGFTFAMLTPLQPGHFSILRLALQCGGLIGMIGWLFANFFHKLHE